MNIERAIHLANLWSAGKMIGGNESETLKALLKEIKNLRRLSTPIPMRPMSEAPRDREILAYHADGKTLHQVMRDFSYGGWTMRWNVDYKQRDKNYLGWVPLPEVIVDGGEG